MMRLGRRKKKTSLETLRYHPRKTLMTTSATCVERRLVNTVTMEDKCAPPAAHSSDEVSSPSIMKYFSASLTNIARSPLKLAKLANFAGNASQLLILYHKLYNKEVF